MEFESALTYPDDPGILPQTANPGSNGKPRLKTWDCLHHPGLIFSKVSMVSLYRCYRCCLSGFYRPRHFTIFTQPWPVSSMSGICSGLHTPAAWQYDRSTCRWTAPKSWQSRSKVLSWGNDVEWDGAVPSFRKNTIYARPAVRLSWNARDSQQMSAAFFPNPCELQTSAQGSACRFCWLSHYSSKQGGWGLCNEDIVCTPRIWNLDWSLSYWFWLPLGIGSLGNMAPSLRLDAVTLNFCAHAQHTSHPTHFVT